MMNETQVDSVLSEWRLPVEPDGTSLEALDDAWAIMTAARLLLRDHPFEADLRQCALRLERIGMRQLDALAAQSDQRSTQAETVKGHELEARDWYASAHAA